ncbi:MAG: carbon-nitrogen hydrolase family protein [Aquificae bacterium]|nr:carbon-nitrogen hydrolase family protein [Aquificota bacterium]
MKLASVQIRPQSPEKNLKRVISFLESVPERSVVALPELWLTGLDYDTIRSYADKTPEVLELLSDISAKRKLLVCGTLPEKTAEGLMNTAFLIDNGKLIGRRPKIKLFPLFDEDRYFVPGRKNEVFETSFGKVGVLICFELRFTDLVLELQRNKPDIVLVPAQWGYARRRHFSLLSQARAVELQSYLVASNTWGEGSGTRFAGRSGIYSPWGEVLAYSEKGDALLVAGYDPLYLSEVRRALPIKM